MPTDQMVSPLEIDNIIGGRSRSAVTTFEVRDPGRVTDIVAVVADGGAAEVDAAVAAAQHAAPGWAATPLTARLAALRSGAARMGELIDELAPLLSRENGALPIEARMDLDRGMSLFGNMIGLAADFLRPVVTDTGLHRLMIEKRSIGPTALVVPWNSPIVLTMGKAAPALAAGNPIIVKPSPEAPVVLTRVLEVLAAVLPPGVVNVVNSSAAAGPLLTAHPGVAKVSFTGSTQVGRAVMRSAADTIKRVSLELGGNDPAIVLPDTDFGTIMDALCKGAFTRAGQICFAVKRVYVPRSRYREFCAAICAWVDDFVVGHYLDEGVAFGPLISRRQLDSVRGFADRAAESGAILHRLGAFAHPGTEEQGYYLRPVVVTDIAPDAELVTSEQFGPVLPVIAYDDVDDAVAMANAGDYGLASSVWSDNPETAFEVARRIEAGCTFINSHNVWSLSFDMPFGGVKHSGIGRERTVLGLQEYVEEHAMRWIKPTA